MHRITAHTAAPLFGTAATRQLEARAAAALPPHTLMQRAGTAVAQLALALAPHARTVWIACGPGNNGGDGFEAAAQLQARGMPAVVSWRGEVAALPQDARASHARAEAAGVHVCDTPPAHWDLAIDALLGLGGRRPPEGHLADWLQQMHASEAPVLAVDLPSGLDADTGRSIAPALAATAPRHCLSLLSLKPGQFTHQGRDRCGTLWFDDLGSAGEAALEAADAHLAGAPLARTRAHASHKGSYGDVAVIGGAPGMVGAAVLAGMAALHAGAGRVFVGALDAAAPAWDPGLPELMFRPAPALPRPGQTVVCGCGGGTAVAAVLPRVLAHDGPLVLDADALNALAADAGLQAALRQRQAVTVVTPHPLEAARLLGGDTPQVQSDRLQAARTLSLQLDCVVVLKGSGSVIASPHEAPVLNPTGNARLASAGTGDVLAGFIGALLAQGLEARAAACEAVWRHGALADHWPAKAPLTASALARSWPQSEAAAHPYP